LGSSYRVYSLVLRAGNIKIMVEKGSSNSKRSTQKVRNLKCMGAMYNIEILENAGVKMELGVQEKKRKAVIGDVDKW
jgi:hypothetical protein